MTAATTRNAAVKKTRFDISPRASSATLESPNYKEVRTDFDVFLFC